MNEIYHARWEKCESLKEEKMFCLDMNSAHAFAAFQNLPIGEYVVSKKSTVHKYKLIFPFNRF